MQRKRFIRHSLLAGAGLLTAGAASASSTAAGKSASDDKTHQTGSGHFDSTAGKPFNLNYGTHDGMFRNSGGTDFIDQIKYAYDQGFRSIEDNGMSHRPPEQQQKIG